MSVLLYGLGLLIVSVSSVTIDEYGDIGTECYAEINTQVSKLSSDDLASVDELKFVQVLYRHGARLGSTQLEAIFPDEEFSFECNTQTVFSQAIRSDTDDNDLTEASNRFNWVFTEDEQYYAGSNCETTQLADSTPKQMMNMGNIIADRYFSNNNGNSHDNDEFDKEYLSSDFVDFYAIKENRCVQSTVWFAEGLFEESTQSNKDEILALELHNTNSDPFRGSTVADCLGNDEYVSWASRYSSGTNNSATRSDYWDTAEVQAVGVALESEGGVFTTRHLTEIARWYCSGIDIPLSIDTFQACMDVTTEYGSTYDESDNGQWLNRCYRHQVHRSAYHKTLEHLSAALESEDNSKMFVIAAQGTRVINYLWGLDLFDDRNIPKQSEMVTLEVYSAVSNDDGIDYYFRWTRDGMFIPFKPCQDYYDSENTELCDLNTLLNDEYGFSDAISFVDWKDTCVNAETLCLCGLCDA